MFATAKSSLQIDSRDSMTTAKPVDERTLQHLIELLAPEILISPALYPPHANVTMVTRLGQIASGSAQLVASRLRGRPGVLISGEKLAHSSDWIAISFDRVGARVLHSLRRGQPFISIAMTQGQFRAVFSRLGIDPAATLDARLSRHSHLIFSGSRAGTPCIVHYAATDESCQNVRRHIEGLRLAHETMGTVLVDDIPALIAANSSSGRCILVEDKISGRTGPKAALPPARVEAMAHAAMEPLKAVYASLGHADGNACAAFVTRELSRLMDALPGYEVCIGDGLGRLKQWIRARDVRTAPAHGDYAARNIIFDDDYSTVRGLIDWEWCLPDAPVGFDALKFALELQATQEGSDVFKVLSDLLLNVENSKFATVGVKDIRENFSLSKTDLWHTAIFIWLHLLWIGAVRTEPVSAAWTHRAVTLPGLAILASAPEYSSHHYGTLT